MAKKMILAHKHIVREIMILLEENFSSTGFRLAEEMYKQVPESRASENLLLDLDDYSDKFIQPFLTEKFGRPIYYGWSESHRMGYLW